MPPPRPVHGFTLIEVLVALAIFAVALAASVRAASVSTDGTFEVRERLLATWTAQNHLALVYARAEFPEPGSRKETVEQGGVPFVVEQVVSAMPNPDVRRIEVRVSTERRGDYMLSRLVGHVFRPR